MKTHFTVALSIITGIAISAVSIQGSHAQTKPKAYSISETETLDTAALTAYRPLIQAALKAAGARGFNTGGGKVVAIAGAAAPKNLVINEWDSLEKAQAFFNSTAWNNLAPQRDKAQKLIRRYVVEAVQ